MTRKQRRLILIGAGLGVLGLAAALVLSALKDSIVFFNSPSDVVEKRVAPGTRIRLGGLVQPGSLTRGDNLEARFAVTDGDHTITVRYRGILPDLFREGQGVVTEGKIDASGAFEADTVLAKHDENYMPKEVADALKKQGHWKDDYGEKAAVRRDDRGAWSLRPGAGAGPGADPGDCVPLVGARCGDVALMRVARYHVALVQFGFVALCLRRADDTVTSRPTSRSSNVFENSHSPKPLLYKITGVWGNHEGSMLLWVSDPRAVRRAGRRCSAAICR